MAAAHCDALALQHAGEPSRPEERMRQVQLVERRMSARSAAAIGWGR